MRKIKFNAWIGSEKKMIYNITQIWWYDDSREVMRLTFKKTNKKGDWIPYWSDFRPDDEVELLQFTGLKDKNGKESFEGDEIKGDLIGLNVGTSGHIIYDTDYGFCNRNDAGNTPLYKLKNIEIIGNIHNKELKK